MCYSKRLYILILSAFLFFHFASGQSTLEVTSLSSQIPIPKGSVNCLSQDSTGFVWIGTWKGLYRYDGQDAVNFTKINPRFKALKIETLLINRHFLWVGTFVSGLYKINLNTYEIIRYNKNSKAPSHIINDNNIISLCAMPDNRVLVGTERGGLNIIAAEGNVTKSYTVESTPNVLNSNQISAITVINDSLAAIGNYGITVLNINNNAVKHYDTPELQQHYADIVKIGDNKLLTSSYNGLFYIELSKRQAITKSKYSHRVKSITHKNNHEYYFGSPEGLKTFNSNNDSIYTPLYSSRLPVNLNINDIVLISSNNLLIGAEDGLYIAKQKNMTFKSYDNFNIISNIGYYKKRIYAGTWGNGIREIHPDMKTSKNIQFDKHAPQFIFSLNQTDDRIWFSSKNDLGIYSFNPENPSKTIKHYQWFKNADDSELMYTITSSLVTNSGLFIVGTWEGLLFFYDKHDDDFKMLTDNELGLPLSRDLSIYTLLNDNNDNIWVGINGGGIIKLRLSGKVITNQELITEKDGLVSNFVTSLHQSKNGMIWIGTEAGLSYINHDSVFSLFHKDIILDIQSITEDKNGNLWLGTQSGLVKTSSLEPGEKHRVFDMNNGLANSSFYLNSVTKHNNTLYFGGYNGIDYFNPDDINSTSPDVDPVITNFSLYNKDIYPYMPEHNTILPKNIFNIGSITLKHHQNTFSFHFSNFQYCPTNKSRFAFKLEGIDNQWNYRSSENRKAYYTKIPPGKYTFLLRSTNSSGTWSEKNKKLDITVLSPFWATTQAYIIYFVAAMLLIFLLVNQWVVKIQKKHQEKLKEIEHKKQKELDELKLRFFTNISHEFRTPLMLILGPLKKILEKAPSHTFHDEHLMIYRNTSRLLKLTNRIVDFRRNEKAQLQLNVEITDLSDFCYNIFLFFNYEAQKRSIKYQFKTTFDEKILIDREFIESVLFNLISNAFKYTPDKSEIEVRVFKGTKNKAIIEVADKGKGINDADIPHIFDRFYASRKYNSTGIGLSFSKRLIELHKGELAVESKSGKGSVFSIIISAKDIYKEDEKAQNKSKEEIDSWAGIDKSYMQQATQSIDKIKSNHSKDELIALIVDDNFDVRQYMKSLLNDNFSIIEAGNGKEALELAYKNIPDIVISDVMMPEMDGFELCDALKNDERTSHIPIILTTVLSEHEDRLKGLKKGADSYIPKPLDPQHLLIRVNKLIENRLKINEKFHLKNTNETHGKNEAEIDPFIEKARNVVLQNIDNSDYNINDFCDDMKLSRMQLYRKFKATTGMSANSFIRKVRMHYAADKLKTGNYSIKEITYDVGFVDLKYFRKCFHDEFGMNPSEYAKQNDT
jgi:signal transduction histidine kinase/ligand-binding sensor domain-containing protein/AraC-like DNA-binding protein